jgi:hypothetical protein
MKPSAKVAESNRAAFGSGRIDQFRSRFDASMGRHYTVPYALAKESCIYEFTNDKWLSVAGSLQEEYQAPSEVTFRGAIRG